MEPVVSPPSFDFFPIFEKVLTYLVAHIPTLIHWFTIGMNYLVVIAIPISLMLVIGTVVAVERLKRIRAKEKAIFDTPQEVQAYEDVSKPDPALQERWKKVTELIESENQNDWRQAIIEADIMLDEMLTKQGYKGESIGDKLKRVEKGDFETYDLAWEAHLVRNRIAHDGSNFELNKYEAKRIITLFKQVFSEFYYV